MAPMAPKTHSARRQHNKTGCGRMDEATLRRAYFAQAGETASRYGVSFDDVMSHLRATRANHTHTALPVVRHIEDLVHAVACVGTIDLAWWDLSEQYERALVRACRQWLEATEAIVFVRRLFCGLRRDDDGEIQPLRGFDGTRTMRRWLGDRIVGRMNTEGTGFALSNAALEGTATGVFDCDYGTRIHRPLVDGHIVAGNVIWSSTRPRSGGVSG